MLQAFFFYFSTKNLKFLFSKTVIKSIFYYNFFDKKLLEEGKSSLQYVSVQHAKE